MAASISPDDADLERGPSRPRARIVRETAATLRVVSRGGLRRPRPRAPQAELGGHEGGVDDVHARRPLGARRNEVDSVKAERAALDEG